MARSRFVLVIVCALAGQLGCSGSPATRVDAGMEAGREAGPAETGSGHRTLTKVVDDAPWRSNLQRAGGIAVDGQNRVYFEDTENVWLIDGQNVSTYLTLAEAAAKTPPTLQNWITDLDRGPDGLLYVALRGNDSTGAVAAVVRSSSAHVAQPWIDVSSIGVARLNVISADRVAIINVGGLYTATAASQTLVYANALLENRENCAAQDLSAAPTGTFLYQPGCNGSEMYRGNVDGSGVATFTGFLPNFICTARDPNGGFYIVLDDCPDCVPRIYHLPDGATDKAQATLVDTTPSLAEAQAAQNDPLSFVFCSMAAASDGSLYLQSGQQLWKASP